MIVYMTMYNMLIILKCLVLPLGFLTIDLSATMFRKKGIQLYSKKTLGVNLSIYLTPVAK